MSRWRDELGIRESEELDPEGKRRLLNQYRRNFRRRGRRGKWLAALAEIEPPEVIEELERLRRYNPALYRKAIRKLAKKHGVHGFHERFTSRDKPDYQLGTDNYRTAREAGDAEE